tara:strand:+ start:402 stop:1853 length:1452 start_codon:yes stop_codon:yes gene_type:complete
MANKTYTVTVASGDLYGGGTGNVFYLDGVRNATGPGTIDWVADATLRFEQSASSNNNHPLIFSTTTSKDQYLTSGVTYYLDGAVTYSQYTNTTTFNAATTRYVEITPSSFTDFYYLCYVHGIGMGGIMDMVISSWGAHPYNQGAWNQNQDLTVFVSNPNDSLWGDSTWGSSFWGGGQNMDMSLNNSGITITNQINQGWGSDTWGTETWGESGNVHQVTGLAMTAAEGSSGISINGDSSLIATGNRLTVSTPSTTEAFSAFVATPTGLPMVAQVNFNPAFAQPGGISMSVNLGTVVADNITIAEVSAKSASTWGNSNWGFGVYGNQPVNTLVMAMSENFSGVDPAPDATLTGQAMAMFVADVEVHADGNTSAGDTTMSWGDATWGNSRWGNGIFNADPNYGQTMAATLGQEIVDVNTPIDVSGIALTVNLGTVTTTQETKVFPSGNALTFALGTATNVLIWNEVNTGTAPVDPPGWQEVNTNAA